MSDSDLKSVVERLNAIERHLAPKTDVELLAEIKSVSTPEQWQRIVALRVDAASLEDCVAALAESQGMSTEDYTNPSAKNVREVMQMQSAEKVHEEQRQRAERKQRLIDEANSI